MRFRLVIVAGLGLALVFYLLLHAGLGSVLAAAVQVGWGGFALLCLYALALLALLGAAWHALMPAAQGNRLWVFVWARMVRDGATDVLPFSQLGGIVLGARAAVLHGVARPMAYASTIVDVTTEMLAQGLYIAIGLAILLLRAPRTSLAASTTRGVALGLLLAALGALSFVALRRHGRRLLGSLAARLLPGALAATADLRAAFDALYRSKRRLSRGAALHFAGWLVSAAGTWIALRLMQVRAELTAVVALESLVCAVRSAGVIVPISLGVQETAYAVLAPLFGIGADVGLAVSLLKRARDIAIGVPTLLVWQAVEGRRALAAEPAP